LPLARKPVAPRRNGHSASARGRRIGLTKRRFTFDDLFVRVFQGRKRGDEFRF
jgi:hypothetical protein